MPPKAKPDTAAYQKLKKDIKEGIRSRADRPRLDTAGES